MERKIGIDKPVTVDGVTLISVTKSLLNCQHIDNRILCFGAKHPFIIVALSQTMRQAFDITGQEIALDQLIQDIPGIKEIMEKHHPYDRM